MEKWDGMGRKRRGKGGVKRKEVGEKGKEGGWCKERGGCGKESEKDWGKGKHIRPQNRLIIIPQFMKIDQMFLAQAF
jgi:hypothetical protein